MSAGQTGRRIQAAPMPPSEGPPSDGKPRSPDSLWRWLRNLRRKAQVAFATLYLIPLATLLWTLLRTEAVQGFSLSLEVLRVSLYGIQAVVVLILSFTVPRPRPTRDELAALSIEHVDVKRAGESAREFFSLWTTAWFCWGLLYAGFALLGLHTMFNQGVKPPWFQEPLLNLLNNIQTLFLVLCFRELRFPTHETKNPQFRAIALLLLIAAMESVLRFAPSPIADTWGKTFGQVVGWSTGFAAGTAIALLVGRLESRFIDLHVLIAAVLYLYAAIQAPFIDFSQNKQLALVLTSLAFILKIVLYTVVAWLLSSKKLIFYLAQMQALDQYVPEKESTFFASTTTARAER